MAAADGFESPLQQSSHWLKQDQNFVGWSSHTCVDSVIVFAPEELIRCAAINCPGSWHDSTQADCGVHRKLKQIHALCGMRVVADSAFGLQSKDFVVKSGQEDPTLQGPATRAEEARVALSNRQAASSRQLLENRMRMVQGQFPRSKDDFRLKKIGEWKAMLHQMVLLFNWQASKTGIKQILNTLMSGTGCKPLSQPVQTIAIDFD